MFEWFSTAVASANAAKEISKSLITLRDEEMIRSRVFDLTNNLMDLQQQMMQAQVEQMELVKKVADLEAALQRATRQDEERGRYQLHKFPKGDVAYVLRPEFQLEEPEHYLCSNCFEKGERVTLHSASGWGWAGLKCPRCSTQVKMRDAPVPQMPRI
jgi:hypothetical protein